MSAIGGFQLQPFSPRDLISSNAWSSILFTTYSLSLSFLEAIPLSAVYKSYKNFTVISDIEGYRASLADVGAVGVGRDYDLVPVRCRTGVFHPKIALLADEDGNIRATVGSGNLTFGGWGYNNEVLDYLSPGRDSVCFADLAGMLESMMRATLSGGRLECVATPDLAPFIDIARKGAGVAGEGTSRLLHTMDRPLAEQIAEMTEDLGGAEHITVVSPFFSGHHGVRLLCESILCDNVSVAVPAVAPSVFDFAAAAGEGLVVLPVRSDTFSDQRSLHSKLFDIECARGRLVVGGSANATTPALSGSNVEAVVARIHDRAPLFGWSPATVYNVSITGENEPSQRGGATLVVEYSGGVVSGRLVGGAGSAGEWDAVLASGARRSVIGRVEIGEDGEFDIAVPDRVDPLSFGSSVQLVYSRGAEEVRGWLVLRGFLDAMNRRGPLVRSIGRHVSGLGTSGDMGIILEFVAKDPGALLAAAERTGGGRQTRSSASHAFVKGAFGTMSALDMRETWRSGSGARGPDDLIDALVRSLTGSLPADNDDAGDDEDEEKIDGGQRRGTRPSNAGGGGQRIRQKIVERAFTQLFAKMEAVPAGPTRGSGLCLLFDMIARIVPRAEDAERLLVPYLERWLGLARGARPQDEGQEGLDDCVVAVVSRLVIGDPAKSGKMHQVLQAWLGGEVSDAFAADRAPMAGALDQELLGRGIPQETWSAAWESILSSKTPWNTVNDLRRALLDGTAFVAPEGTSDKELAVFRRFAAREGRPDRIYWMERRHDGRPACRCGHHFPGIEEKRLNKLRIATCDNFLCGRVVVDVSL
ncbi:hypothetical protein [Rhizobium mayense]|uniref:PLD phosphodiesterase domain-containing protein n=1 Tax=Rhizobium mayense TaxID=1312184 RepID=A0ABT7JT51_9HYPH|nr:hypothetical protein [Rhizobium mayense]MDL2399461.1 hypothetical protein [Rhizobium mayense]